MPAAAMLQPSLKITPWKRSLPRSTSCSQKRENPAGWSSCTGEDHMRQHDALQAGVDQADERLQILLHQGIEAAPVDRQIEMRVGSDAAMPGKCLPTLTMPASRAPSIQAPASWLTVSAPGGKRAVADHAADAVVQVEHRRKTEIDAGLPAVRLPSASPSRARRGEPSAYRYRSVVQSSGRQSG